MTEFIKLSVEDYKALKDKVKYYSEYDYEDNQNGMKETLSTINQDYLDDITSEKEESELEEYKTHQKVRYTCVEDTYEFVYFLVYESGAKYNKTPDKQLLRRIKPYIR